MTDEQKANIQAAWARLHAASNRVRGAAVFSRTTNPKLMEFLEQHDDEEFEFVQLLLDAGVLE